MNKMQIEFTLSSGYKDIAWYSFKNNYMFKVKRLAKKFNCPNFRILAIMYQF